jgi:hypothetical protein
MKKRLLTASEVQDLVWARTHEANRLRHLAEPWVSQAESDRKKRNELTDKLQAAGVPAQQVHEAVFVGHAVYGPGNTVIETPPRQPWEGFLEVLSQYDPGAVLRAGDGHSPGWTVVRSWHPTGETSGWFGAGTGAIDEKTLWTNLKDGWVVLEPKVLSEVEFTAAQKRFLPDLTRRIAPIHPDGKNWRHAYLALRSLVLEVKDARGFEADRLARKAGKDTPGFAEWGTISSEINGLRSIGRTLQHLLRNVNEIDREVADE